VTDETKPLACANCGQRLDPADKFCRECGLPTMRRAAERQRIPAAPPDTGEMKRALNAVPDPQPFMRLEAGPEDTERVAPPVAPSADGPLTRADTPPETTGDVLRATSPTQAVQMASSTLLMLIGLMVVLAVAGAVLLIVALRG